MKRVLCFGTFDGLHPGHEDFMRQARGQGDYLTVVVARDATTEQVKGHRPQQSEEERLAAVRTVRYVDEAQLGGVGDKYAVIEELKPDVIVLGYDQEAFTDGLAQTLEDREFSCDIFRAYAFHPEQFKTSLMRVKGKE